YPRRRPRSPPFGHAAGGSGVRPGVRGEGDGRRRYRCGRRGLATCARARLRHDRAGADPGFARARLLAVEVHRARRRAARERGGAKSPARAAALRSERGVRVPARAGSRGAGAATPGARRLQGFRARRVRARSARRHAQARRGQHAPADLGGDRDAARLRPRADRLRRSLRRAGRGDANLGRRSGLDLPGEGRVGLGADGAPGGARCTRVPLALPAPPEGARALRGGRPVAGAREHRLPALARLMRLALVDPLSYTPPYDHGLAAALARRGHELTLLAGPFLHGSVPEPVGYLREEVFLPLSGRLFRPAPRSRLRLLLKGGEYLPRARRLLRRLAQLQP